MRTDHGCGAVYEVDSISALRAALGQANDPIVVGGGSNILFTSDSERDLLAIRILERTIEKKGDTHIDLALGAGEDWHQIVLWSLSNDWGGLENLSLIPGLCGAAPMQNIGAYGVELEDVLLWVEAIDRSDGSLIRLEKSACKLGYRDSIFKNELKNKVIIVRIGIRLTRAGNHQLNTSYGAIESALESEGITSPYIQDLSRVIVDIRQSKLPDPQLLPNNGSFFKNPIISVSLYQELLSRFNAIPHYAVDEKNVKVPAGWLIDQCGWKGKRIGSVGVHEHQALVLVNHGTDNGADIVSLAEEIQASVKNRFGIQLEPEVNFYP